MDLICEEITQKGFRCRNKGKNRIKINVDNVEVEKLLCGVHIKKYQQNNFLPMQNQLNLLQLLPGPIPAYRGAAAAAAGPDPILLPTLNDSINIPFIDYEQKQKQKQKPLPEEKIPIACFNTLDCGHGCDGVFSDINCICLKCLNLAHENCIICMEELSSESVVKLECGHIFHYQCCLSQMKGCLTGLLNFAAIQTKFSCCLCKALMIHPLFRQEQDNMLSLREKMEKKLAELILGKFLPPRDLQSLETNKNGSSLEDVYFFECNMCSDFSFGGYKSCLEGSEIKPENQICTRCFSSLDKTNCSSCKIHGQKFISYRCTFCCNEAMFHCGIGFFCSKCHSSALTRKLESDGSIKTCSVPSCLFGGFHPKEDITKKIHPLGCSRCKSSFN